MSVKPVNRRRERRVRARLRLRYSAGVEMRTAFTRDIAYSGVFVITRRPERPGTPVTLRIQIQNDVVSLSGTVAWARRVPIQLQRMDQSGFGVELHNPPYAWEKLIDDISRS